MSRAFVDASAVPVLDLLSLAGRRALVTGGAQGLGRAIAARLAEAGARVAVADLDADRARAAAEGLPGTGHLGVRMDVSDSASVAQAAAAAAEELGGLDLWVNNAGVFPAVPVPQMTDELWEHVFAVNTRGVFHGSREAATRMTEGGVIVNIASTAGIRGTAPGLAAYVGSKHAVVGMTKQMSIEFAPRGIRVLAVAPTFVPTEGNLAAAAAHPRDEGTPPPAAMMSSPIGRVGTPDDIARVVLFAASDLASIMTGSTLLADAGTTA